MGRPRYAAGETPAREKLIGAYWELLEEDSFENVTVRAIARRAGVNHNTFYRHFGSLEELARAAFEDVVLPQIPLALLNLSIEAPMLDDTQLEGLRRARIYARSGSGLLLEILRSALEGAWLRAAQVCREELTSEQRIDCGIIFGGISCILGSDDFEAESGSFAKVLSRPLGQGMLRTLADIRQASDRCRTPCAQLS